VVATEWLTRCADRLCPRPVAACTLSTCERDRLVSSERPEKQLCETHRPEITGVFASAWASVRECHPSRYGLLRPSGFAQLYPGGHHRQAPSCLGVFPWNEGS
jgi:hypothetical protein